MSSTLSTKSNPWLNDNGVFIDGCLVDQRQGYVVKPGANYYKNGSTTKAGITENWITAKSIDANGNANVTIDGVNYWVYKTDVFRGYTGAGYGPDRWKILYESSYCLIQDGYVSFYGVDFGQFIETSRIPLNTPLTYSVLTAEGILGSITFQFDGTQSQSVYQHIGETKFRANFIYNWGGTYTPFFLQTEGNVINVVAMKLELGTHQTLAHQDSSGNWVLNELPNYADTLARCQRYFYRWPYLVQYLTLAANGGFGMADFQFPVTMRTVPTITNIAGTNTDLSTFSFIAGQGGVHFQNTGTDMVSITNFDAVADL